jgi:hypothetical protein
MLHILRLWAWARSTRRHIFGAETPHWATDLYKFCKFLNAIELAPTVFAILLAPDHFFRRRHLITAKRSFGLKSVYRSPIGFAGRIVVLLFGLSWIKTLDIPEIKVIWAGLLLFLALPFAIPSACFLFVVAGAAAHVVARVLWMGDIFRDAFHGPRATLFWLWIPIAPSTYRSLRWREYFWGLFYLYGYLLVVPAVALAGLGATYLLAVSLEGILLSLFDWHPETLTQLRIWLLPLAAGLWIAARVVVYPYIALLVASARPRSPLMLRCQHYSLRGTFEDLASKLREYGRASRNQKRPAYTAKLRSELTSFIATRLSPQWTALERAIDVELPPNTPAENREEYLRTILKGLSLRALCEALNNAPADAPEHPLLLVLRGFPLSHAEARAAVQGVHEAPALAIALQSAISRCRKLAAMDPSAELHAHYRDLLDYSLAHEIPSAFRASTGLRGPREPLTRRRASDLDAVCSQCHVDWSRYPVARRILDEVQEPNRDDCEATKADEA